MISSPAEAITGGDVLGASTLAVGAGLEIGAASTDRDFPEAM